MALLADFSRSATLGFQSGQQMAEGQNPLGQFVRSMLSEYRNKKVMEMETQSKMGVEVFKSKLEQDSPLYKAQTKSYESLANKREIPDVDTEIKQEAWERYKKGDKSPEVLRAIGRYVSPMEVMIAQSMGLSGEQTMPEQKTPLPIVDYKKLSEQELFAKAKAGDKKAKEEAKKRGYIKK